MASRVALALSIVGLLPAVTSAQDLFDQTQVRTLRLTFANAGYWSELLATHTSGAYVEADLEVDGVVYQDVGVQVRGRSAFSCAPSQKAPLKIEMDVFVPDQELYGYREMRLNNGIGDPTYVREVILGNLLQPYLAEPKRTWVNVETNGVNRGVYILEQQKDGQFMRENFASDEGHRYYAIAPNTLQYQGSQNTNYASRYDLRTPDHPNPWFDLVEVARRLAQAPAASLASQMEEVLDVQSALWMFAATAVFCNWDGYMGNSNNWYYVEEQAHGLGVPLHHDLNLAWGTWGTLGANASIYNGSTASSRPLSARLLNEPRLRREFQAHVRTLANEVFDWALIEPMVLQYQTMLDPFVFAEPVHIYPYAAFRGNLLTPTPGPCWQIPSFQPFVVQRKAFLLGLAELTLPRVTLDQLQHWPLAPRSADPITVTVRTGGPVTPASVELRWRTEGPYNVTAMHDDGGHGDGAANDGIYGTVLPPHLGGSRIELYVVAVAPAPGDARTFSPSKGTGEPHRVHVSFDFSGVRITEYMYDGSSGEYVELTNTSAQPIDMAGWSLDDQSANVGVIPLDAAGVLAPGASLVVTDAAPAIFRARWGLGNVPVVGSVTAAPLGRADAIHVFDPTGRLSDSLHYGDEVYPGTLRAKDVSGTVCAQGVGADDPYAWVRALVGDAQGSHTSTNGDVGSPGQWVSTACQAGGIGYVHCTSAPNSSGSIARITAAGSRFVDENELTLGVDRLPVGALGYFLASRVPANVPGLGGGPGVLCLGGTILRFATDVVNAGATGVVVQSPDLYGFPGQVVVAAGETWHFQFWFRDFTTVPTSNTSDGLTVQFH
jgi:hypothetical protein